MVEQRGLPSNALGPGAGTSLLHGEAIAEMTMPALLPTPRGKLTVPQRDQLPRLELVARSLDSTIIKLHARGTGAPRKGGGTRSEARAACPWLEQGAA